jgi:hypothetical protein
MKHIKKYSSAIALSGLGAILASGLSGCDGGQNATEQSQGITQEQKKNAFVVIEEVAKGEYKIKEEFPSDEMRIVLKQFDGTERVLSKEEMDKLIKEEEIKIDNNTSNLTKPKSEEVSSGHSGMGLGETILASAAGAMLGAYIGNKLFGNQNYNQNRQTNYKSPSTYSKSANSFGKNSASSASSSSKKSGFFGNSGSSSRSSSSSFGG